MFILLLTVYLHFNFVVTANSTSWYLSSAPYMRKYGTWPFLMLEPGAGLLSTHAQQFQKCLESSRHSTERSASGNRRSNGISQCRSDIAVSISLLALFNQNSSSSSIKTTTTPTKSLLCQSECATKGDMWLAYN